jgi:hypothetical protein
VAIFLEELKGMERISNNQLDHWLITPSFWCATCLLTALMMLLFGIGFFLFYKSYQLQTLTIEYGTYCQQFRDKNNQCEMNFILDKDMVDPKVYYRLDNFYANYRQYVKSRDWK